ncbi:hypothetical protein NC99_32850 [Sunxiuqinia dokdonensis]|uniref:Uncharacterized protein n=1 Tax=Sunxiuqinia dokdonensis TaxID=1409788 RepID=A0A0L8V655_9BACT|nr:hypothetical protein NC99_32850 [Sunxiuqinia dokdonensis]
MQKQIGGKTSFFFASQSPNNKEIAFAESLAWRVRNLFCK